MSVLRLCETFERHYGRLRQAQRDDRGAEFLIKTKFSAGGLSEQDKILYERRVTLDDEQRLAYLAGPSASQVRRYKLERKLKTSTDPMLVAARTSLQLNPAKQGIEGTWVPPTRVERLAGEILREWTGNRRHAAVSAALNACDEDDRTFIRDWSKTHYELVLAFLDLCDGPAPEMLSEWEGSRRAVRDVALVEKGTDGVPSGQNDVKSGSDNEAHTKSDENGSSPVRSSKWAPFVKKVRVKCSELGLERLDNETLKTLVTAHNRGTSDGSMKISDLRRARQIIRTTRVL